MSFLFSDCKALVNLRCRNTKITSVIPDWLDLPRGGYRYEDDGQYEQRYLYKSEYVDGKWVIKDKGYGWWYPGEPAKGYHGRN